MANLLGDSDMYLKVTSGWPSLIIRWTTIKDLKTIVQVESRSRSCKVRKTSATPDSPPFVADKIGSIYFDLGAANYHNIRLDEDTTSRGFTFIFVAPLTVFSISAVFAM